MEYNYIVDIMYDFEYAFRIGHSCQFQIILWSLFFKGVKLTFYGSFFFCLSVLGRRGLFDSLDSTLLRRILNLLKVLFIKFYSNIARLFRIILGSFITKFWTLNSVILLRLKWFLDWAITAYRGMIICLLIVEC